MQCWKIRIGLGLLTTFVLVLGGCAPAAAPAVTPHTESVRSEAPARTPSQVVTPTASPAGPAATPKLAGEQPRYGGILAISATGDPLSLDMHQEAAAQTENVVQCAYNGVTQFDPSNPKEVIGDLAKSWELSKDGLAYTFRLQENVKFHDGSPFSSEDVRFSFERQLNPPRGVLAQRRASLGAIDKLETPDKNTVKFLLKYPSGPFLDVISSGWMVIYSEAFVAKKGHMKNDVMGTGPYKLKRYAAGTSLEYVKNPDYFVEGRPYLDGIAFYIVKDPGTRLAALRTGRIKLTGPRESYLTKSQAEVLTKTIPQVVILPYHGFTHVNFIMNTQEKPWTDDRVRKAAYIAIDRQKAIDVLDEGIGDVGSYFPGKWGMPKEELEKMPGYRQPKDADIAEAKRLLAEANYPNGFTAKALVRAGKEYENIAVYLADQLAKIGIKLDLDVKEAAVRTKLLNDGAFSCHPNVSTLAFGDPDDVARYWAEPLRDDWGMNWQRESDNKIWTLFASQSRAVDPAERMRIVRELDLRMMESASRPQIHWRKSLMAMWPEVRGRNKVIGDFSLQKYQDVWLAK